MGSSDRSGRDLFPEPFEVAQLVDLQPDAIVSRILVKHPSGSITFFAFDAGQSVEEHTAPFDAMIHVVEGTAEVSVAGKWHTVPAHHAILLPAGVPHAVRAPQPFKMLLVMLRKP